MNIQKLAPWAGVAVVVMASAIWLGNVSGEAAGQAAVERLEVLWPSITSAPERDRAFLAGLSITCHLHDKPIERSEIIACLREAARGPNATLPEGEERADAADRLERLLAIASL